MMMAMIIRVDTLAFPNKYNDRDEASRIRIFDIWACGMEEY